MKFGKIKSLENVTFQLKPLTLIEKRKNSSGNGKLYLGGKAWGNSEWKGTLYPSNAKEKDFLKYYQQQLNTIELNTTYYRIPDIPTIIKWKNQVKESFKFCPKVPLLISRTKDLDKMKYFVDEFTNHIRHFEKNLGPCFVQWPETSGMRDFHLFEYFAHYWPSDIEVSMEFRNQNCFEGGALQVDLLSLLADNGIDCVVTDVAGRRDVVHNTIINNNLLIRFVSCGDFLLDCSRLDEWKIKLDSLNQVEKINIYLLVHEGENSQNAELTIYADKLFNQPKQIELWGGNINSLDKNQTSLF